MKTEFDEGLILRMRALLDHLNFNNNKSAFAREAHLTYQGLAQVYRGRNLPTLKMLARIAQANPNKINWNWLIEEQGDIASDTDSSIPKETGNQNASVVPTQDYYLKIIAEKDKKIIAQEEKINQLNERVISMLETQIKNMQQ